MRSYYRAKAPSYVMLASRIFQGATTGDLGRTAGAKSIAFASGTENWTLVNGTANFLAADPTGLAIDANGIFMTSGSSASLDDWGDGNVLGPCIYKLVSEMVPSSLWSGTTLGLSAMYAWIDFVYIVDATSANAGNEAISCGYGATSSFVNGASGRAGFAAAAAAGSTIQRSTFNGNLVATSTFSFPGSAIPTAIRVRASASGMEVSYGVASGLTPPSAWYSREAIFGVAPDNTPNGASGALNTAMVAAIGIYDTNGGGAFKGIVKALYIYGQRLPTGQSLTVAA
jgi:hypothetical protein